MKRRTARVVVAAVLVIIVMASCPMPMETPLRKMIEDKVEQANKPSDTVNPTIGLALVVGTVTQTTVALSWGAAADDVSSVEALEYRVAYASSEAALSSVDVALLADAVMEWSANTTATTATGFTPDTQLWFCVLVRDEAGNKSLYAPVTACTLNATQPTPGSGPTFSEVEQTILTVSWGAATDDETPANELEYKLVRAEAASLIDTVEEANGTSGGVVLEMDWSTAVTACAVDGLSPLTIYNFAVLVRDGAGNLSLYAPQQVTTLSLTMTVTFDAQGGSTPVPTTKQVNRWSAYGSLATTDRSGYTLAGWWTEPGGGGTQVTETTIVSQVKDHTLFAKWTANTYLVTFNPEGGTTPVPTDKVVTYGSAYGTLATTSRACYLFEGWWTGSGGTGTEVTAATTVTALDNHTLYAKWVFDCVKLLAMDVQTSDYFGYSVAISGDYTIVGAPYEDAGGISAGAAYVFHRTGTSTWNMGYKLVAGAAGAYDIFGYSVAISGDNAIVGAPYEDTGGSDDGAVYVFHWNGTYWGGTKLVASDAQADDSFGYSVAISGDYVIVGSPYEDTGGSCAGAAYIFHRTGTYTWDSGTKIVASDAQALDYFGSSVAISGDYAVVGAPLADAGFMNAGAVYLFHRTSSWDSGTKLVASDAQLDDQFGYSVSISGDYVIVGAPYEDGWYNNSGAVYVFHNTSSWDTGTKIVASDAWMNDDFGYSVAISGDYAIVGAFFVDTGGTDAGAAYMYHRTGPNAWDGGNKLIASDAQAEDEFGCSVAISGNYAIVGADKEDTGGTEAGAAYVIGSIVQ